jgi:predicted nucleic acid-binding protein
VGRLDDIPGGAAVLIDSTILHYACVEFQPATAQCIRFLSRVSNREFAACLTVAILNDAVHKVMCSEAVERFNRPRAGLVGWMKRNPQQVRKLSRGNDLINLIKSLPIRILPVGVETLALAQGIVSSHGLLASDALIVALMNEHGVTDLATNDDDFDQVAEISVWKPR